MASCFEPFCIFATKNFFQKTYLFLRTIFAMYYYVMEEIPQFVYFLTMTPKIVCQQKKLKRYENY